MNVTIVADTHTYHLTADRYDAGPESNVIHAARGVPERARRDRCASIIVLGPVGDLPPEGRYAELTVEVDGQAVASFEPAHVRHQNADIRCLFIEER